MPLSRAVQSNRTQRFVVHVLCHYDDSNSLGGLEKQAGLLARTLAARGESVLLLASTRKFSRARWSHDGPVRVRLFWTPHSPQVSGRYFPAALIWALQVLLWLVRHRRSIALLHVHQLRIHAFVAAIARRWFGIPVILKSGVGGPGADIKVIGTRKYFGPLGRRYVMGSGAVFVATTESIVEDLVRYGVARDAIRLIPNGTVLPRLEPNTPSRREHGLFLARVDRDKNPVNLAAAAARVADDRFNIDIFGTGNEADNVAAVVSAAANPHLRYCGFSADPARLLCAYGWLLLPSDAEGLSNSMIEAMVHGVVPVVTRVSGCTDHVESGVTGFFFEGVEAGQIEQTLRQLAQVTDAQWLALSERARLHAAGCFDIERVAQAYRELYRELCARSVPS